tara:strand:- start:14 stop:391 length:378 start_codon:yes stop_codon:yes gene_type:complete
MAIDSVMLLVVPMVILDSSFGSLIVGIFGLEDGEKIVGSTNKVDSARSFRNLLLSFIAFLFLVDTMLFQEELVLQTQICVISDLDPCTIAMSVDTNEQHPILSGTPLARVVSCLGCVRDPKVLEV